MPGGATARKGKRHAGDHYCGDAASRFRCAPESCLKCRKSGITPSTRGHVVTDAKFVTGGFEDAVGQRRQPSKVRSGGERLAVSLSNAVARFKVRSGAGHNRFSLESVKFQNPD